MTITPMNNNPNLRSDMTRIGNLVHHGGSPSKQDHTSWMKIKEYINELEHKVKELTSNLNKLEQVIIKKKQINETNHES